ncbi:MAG: transporter substrate-binding domain-containing protein [Oscillospiraceae bacterium]|nr:transporter substrate-binding domain-containing protein [Oscillospiraceae bacterium]
MIKRFCAGLLMLALLLTALTACNSNDTVVVRPHPVILDEAVATFHFGIAFHRGNAALRDQVWAALQVLSANGTVGQIARNWFGHDPTMIPPDMEATAAIGAVRERTLIIGFDPTMAPMSFQNDNGELVGFDIDLARAVCDYFGWTLQPHPINWADRELELQSGNVDCLWGGVTLTDHMRARLYCTEPYMENRQVVVTMSNSGIRNHRGLRGGYISLTTGSAAEMALAENSGFRDSLGAITIREHQVNCLRFLERGHTDAVLMDEVSAVFYVRTGDINAFGGVR